MSGYLKAYRERMKRNHQTFLEMAEKLKELGCVVKRSKNQKLISFLIVEKGGKCCVFGFDDVPFRWSVGITYKAGHGRTVLCRAADDRPITPQEIISCMVEKYPRHPKLEDLYEEICFSPLKFVIA